ncbi:MAG: zinc ribbon domain-containing protein [Holophagae bacterium]|jgi:putative FmdB family regulatory protein
MPLYEYQCERCDHHFERIEKASSPTAGVCPDCGGPARRLLGAPALKFKGSGWYVTDYGKGNGGAPATTADTSAAPAPETSKAGSKDTDSKPPSTGSKVA